MERLTKRNESGGISVEDLPAALKKLAGLEDAEEYKRSLIKAAKKIAEFCEDAEDCVGCPFFEKDSRGCALDDTPPSEWDVFGMNAEEE